jgi:hypothetical protein
MAHKKIKRQRHWIDVKPALQPLTAVMRHLETLWSHPVDLTEAARWSIIQTHKQLTAEAAVVGAPVAHKHD